ncbi:MAG TPA: hypothetical protein VGG75_05685 [Trebonia sp.]|jgi:hypothetical protein
MTWFAFKGYDTINLAGTQEKEAVSLGFHGYSTQAAAVAHPNSVNVLQAPVLDLLETDYAYAVKAGEQPGGPNADILNPANDVKGAVQAATSSISIPGLQELGDFFGRLEEGSTWLRAGEIALGMLLIAVGVAKLTNAVPAATKIAKAVA